MASDRDFKQSGIRRMSLKIVTMHPVFQPIHKLSMIIVTLADSFVSIFKYWYFDCLLYEMFFIKQLKHLLTTQGDMSRNAHNNKNCKKEIMLANLANMAKMTILPQSPTRQSTKQ